MDPFPKDGESAAAGEPSRGSAPSSGVVVQVREKKGPLRAAIPYMPFPVAVICLFLNTFVPGLGKELHSPGRGGRAAAAAAVVQPGRGSAGGGPRRGGNNFPPTAPREGREEREAASPSAPAESFTAGVGAAPPPRGPRGRSGRAESRRSGGRPVPRGSVRCSAEGRRAARAPPSSCGSGRGSGGVCVCVCVRVMFSSGSRQGPVTGAKGTRPTPVGLQLGD